MRRKSAPCEKPERTILLLAHFFSSSVPYASYSACVSRIVKLSPLLLLISNARSFLTTALSWRVEMKNASSSWSVVVSYGMECMSNQEVPRTFSPVSIWKRETLWTKLRQEERSEEGREGEEEEELTLGASPSECSGSARRDGWGRRRHLERVEEAPARRERVRKCLEESGEGRESAHGCR
jgi:hypothetical protein